MKRFVKFVQKIGEELSIAWNLYLVVFILSLLVGVMGWGVFASVGAVILGWVFGIAAFLVMFIVGVRDILYSN